MIHYRLFFLRAKQTVGCFVAFCFVLLSIAVPLHGEVGFHHPKGLRLPTEKEAQAIEKFKVKNMMVLPNKIGQARIHEEIKKRGLTPLPLRTARFLEEEIIPVSAVLPEHQAAVSVLPSSVNNSTLMAFPPIGSQHVGSCVAWATTYYQATHEIGLTHGYNNKVWTFPWNYTAFSPKWVYTMMNGGADNGLWITDAYDLLSQNGACGYADFPEDSNYRQWDLNPLDWRKATNFRMGFPQYFPLTTMVSNQQQLDLSNIKQMLNNGHILTFATFVSSWVITKITANPNTFNSHVGEYAATYVKGAPNGAHMLTVVGYDDTIWLDINQNGTVDPGELGAFLVANSWGPNWANKGFIWISYDAFLKQSAVVNGPNSDRQSAANIASDCLISAFPITSSYTPTFLVEFELAQTERNQIKVSGGVSDRNQSSPATYFYSTAMSSKGGPYRFDGTTSTSPLNGKFYIDLSDLVIPNTLQRFYLTIEDSDTGNPTVINSVAFIDMNTEKEILPTTHLPQSIDQGKQSFYVDYTLSQKLASVARSSMEISSPADRETVQGLLPISINTHDNPDIQRVEFFVDSTLVGSDYDTPFMLFLDTHRFSNGPHVLTAISYSEKHNPMTSCIEFNIANPSP